AARRDLHDRCAPVRARAPAPGRPGGDSGADDSGRHEHSDDGLDTSVLAEASRRYARPMQGDADIAAAAALLAEPARAARVTAVLADGALPVPALAERARIAPSTASEHLARLVAGGFLSSEKRGRHRYYGLADPAVAAAVEALALVAPQPPVRSLREATRA